MTKQCRAVENPERKPLASYGTGRTRLSGYWDSNPESHEPESCMLAVTLYPGIFTPYQALLWCGATARGAEEGS